MKTLLLFPMVLLSYLGGCNQSAPDSSTFQLNDTISIIYQKTYTNIDRNINIRFDSVLEDSRCPPEAVCFWAGNAKVRFVFTSAGRADTFALNTTLDSDKLGHRELTIQGYKIKLIGLSPQPALPTVRLLPPVAEVSIK